MNEGWIIGARLVPPIRKDGLSNELLLEARSRKTLDEGRGGLRGQETVLVGSLLLSVPEATEPSVMNLDRLRLCRAEIATLSE